MPFRLRKAPKKDAYWVVDDKGKKYSKDPMPKEKARQQQKALYAAEGRGELRGRGDDEDDEELSRLFAKKVAVEEAPRPTNPTATATSTTTTTTMPSILPRKRNYEEMMRGRPPPPSFMEPTPQKKTNSKRQKTGRGKAEEEARRTLDVAELRPLTMEEEFDYSFLVRDLGLNETQANKLRKEYYYAKHENRPTDRASIVRNVLLQGRIGGLSRQQLNVLGLRGGRLPMEDAFAYFGE